MAYGIVIETGDEDCRLTPEEKDRVIRELRERYSRAHWDSDANGRLMVAVPGNLTNQDEWSIRSVLRDVLPRRFGWQDS